MSKKLLQSFKTKYLNRELSTVTEEEIVAIDKFRADSTREDFLDFLGVTEEDLKSGKYA